MALTPAVVAAVLGRHHWTAAVLFAVAAFTDFADGWLARRYGTATKTGQYLDPIADKLLLSAVYVGLAWIGSAPWWFVWIIFGRDFAILAASAVAMRFTAYNEYAPTIWGKISTCLQIAAAVFLMGANAAGAEWVRDTARFAVWISGAATVWSGIHYGWRGVRFFRKDEVEATRR